MMVLQCRPHLFVSVNISFSYISCVLVLSVIMKVKFEISLFLFAVMFIITSKLMCTTFDWFMSTFHLTFVFESKVH